MTRIYWRDFVKTRAYRFIQRMLSMFGNELVLEWKLLPGNTEPVVTDAYIIEKSEN